MWNEVLKTVLTVVIAALLKLVFGALGIEIDAALFNTIVGAIVLWILVHLGLETAVRFWPRTFFIRR